ncbi:hypothetical protein T492DRAFT_848430 [Pavlovales sp. CCMP2436]|nr:hypothetical protein T492DRAFT_848430 [Pavlovales sp. CCMP2436]
MARALDVHTRRPEMVIALNAEEWRMSRPGRDEGALRRRDGQLLTPAPRLLCARARLGQRKGRGGERAGRHAPLLELAVRDEGAQTHAHLEGRDQVEVRAESGLSDPRPVEDLRMEKGGG